MAKYLQIDSNGNFAEVTATTTSAGSGDSGKIVALNSGGFIDPTMIQGESIVSVVASESLSAGALINLWSNAGVINMRNADNTSSAKRAHGFVSSAVSSSATGAATLGLGTITGLSGLTLGTEYFLGTAGGVTATAPTATNTILQSVGVAKSATELEFASKVPVIRA